MSQNMDEDSIKTTLQSIDISSNQGLMSPENPELEGAEVVGELSDEDRRWMALLWDVSQRVVDLRGKTEDPEVHTDDNVSECTHCKAISEVGNEQEAIFKFYIQWLSTRLPDHDPVNVRFSTDGKVYHIIRP